MHEIRSVKHHGPFIDVKITLVGPLYYEFSLFKRISKVLQPPHVYKIRNCNNVWLNNGLKAVNYIYFLTFDVYVWLTSCGDPPECPTLGTTGVECPFLYERFERLWSDLTE